jgi:hypothetical protein
VAGEAMADAAIAANSDIDMANDKGCLRCRVDMSFASWLISAEPGSSHCFNTCTASPA